MLKIIMDKFNRPPVQKLHLTISAFKDVVFRGFNQASRYGRQQFLFAVLCMAAPLRPGAAKFVTCSYTVIHDIVTTTSVSNVELKPAGALWSRPYIKLTVHIDKNVVPGYPRIMYIPGQVVGIDIYGALCDYLNKERPPSGGYLLAAPSAAGGGKFNSNPYTNFGPAFKKAVGLAQPDLSPAEYSGGSPRKSMAQWLYNANIPRHVIADIGGWKLTHRDAMDGYHTTEPTRAMQVKYDL